MHNKSMKTTRNYGNVKSSNFLEVYTMRASYGERQSKMKKSAISYIVVIGILLNLYICSYLFLRTYRIQEEIVKSPITELNLSVINKDEFLLEIYYITISYNDYVSYTQPINDVTSEYLGDDLSIHNSYELGIYKIFKIAEMVELYIRKQK